MMLDGLKKKLAVSVITGAVRNVATDAKTKATIAGSIAAIAIALPRFSVERLIDCDWSAWAQLLTALCVAGIGWVAARENADGRSTALGAIALALQASQGAVETIVTGVVIQFGAYLAGKTGGKPNVGA
jgi:hypothetical protein